MRRPTPTPTPPRRGPEDPMVTLQRWADGRATLKDVRGYGDDELFTIAKLAYFFYNQGRLEDARTLFEGLYAVNPTDPYVARGLAVVEQACGNSQIALQAYDVAVKLAPRAPEAYAGRAEIRLYLGQKAPAAEDLRYAAAYSEPGSPLNTKVSALLAAITR